MSKELTDRQREILDYIEQHLEAEGRPPTVREVAARFHIASPKGAADHLAALERKGYIERTAGASRGIRLLKPTLRGIPLVGHVAAGHPITAIEQVEDVLELGPFFGKGDLFAVRVQGESMKDCGIMDGDLVIVNKNPDVPNGAIAVAYLDGEATVKRFSKTRNGYRLDPENEAFEPILIRSQEDHFELAGPVVGVVRAMRGR